MKYAFTAHIDTKLKNLLWWIYYSHVWVSIEIRPTCRHIYIKLYYSNGREGILYGREGILLGREIISDFFYILSIFLIFKWSGKSCTSQLKGGSPWTLFKHINRQNNHEISSSYMDILVNRTLYMSCQAGPGIEPGPSALKASALPIELTWQTMELDTTYWGRFWEECHNWNCICGPICCIWHCQSQTVTQQTVRSDKRCKVYDPCQRYAKQPSLHRWCQWSEE